LQPLDDRLARTHRGDDDQRVRGHPPGQLGQQQERRDVGPVDVVDHEHERIVVGGTGPCATTGAAGRWAVAAPSRAASAPVSRSISRPPPRQRATAPDSRPPWACAS
jgi:hypothetical protein